MRRGFTLIEVVIALAFAVMIILVAAQAFSAITKTITTINRKSEENTLLRSGFWTAMQNVDYWDVDASTDAPYYRMHTRHAREDSQDIRRRHFAPLVFSAQTDNEDFLGVTASGAGEASMRPIQNPNVFLPHDPRNWYRNGLFGREVPGMVWFNNAGSGSSGGKLPQEEKIWDNGDWPTMSPRLLFGDYALHQATDASDDGTDPTDPGRFRKLDWNNGDYNTDTGDDLQIHDDQVWNLAFDPDAGIDWRQVMECRARAFWQIHQRLGHFGAGMYMPNGMPWLIADQHGLLPRSSSTPTMMGPATIGGVDQADALESYNAYVSNHDHTKYHVIQTDFDLFRAYGGGATDWLRVMGAGSGGYGSAAFVVWPNRMPTTLSKFHDWGGGAPDYRRINKDVYYTYAPFRVRSSTWSAWGTNENFSNSGTVMKVSRHPTLTSETVLLPFNITDQFKEAAAPGAWIDDELADELKTKLALGDDVATIRNNLRVMDFTSKPDGSPTLTMFFLRYQKFDGAQLTIATVEVANEETGTTLQLRLCPGGTSYRGARQHWAARHIRSLPPGASFRDQDRFGNDPVGDFYEY